MAKSEIKIGDEPKGNTLRERGIYFISGGFDADLARNIVTWILEENFSKKHNHLTLMINSPGGEVPSAFAIIDAMRGSAIPVRTVGLGQIGSCGLLTFIAGEKGTRLLTPNTSILSHQWAWGNRGKEHELFAVVKEYELTHSRLMKHYTACTGLDEEGVRAKLLPPHDVWLSAEEAKELGVCDIVRDMASAA